LSSTFYFMNTTQEFKPLTKYKPGSTRELWSICLPMMLTSITTTLMYFCDRIILARYSIDAMNACVTAWMASAVPSFAVFGIAAISEVFVGQYNGAKRYGELAAPVWQMIYFSLMMGVLFVPMGLFAGPWVIPDAYEAWGVPYFVWVMSFSWLFALIGALSGFFIGQGKAKIVFVVATFGNAVNIGLDIVFVFGVPGFIPEMGAKGAAIATVIAQSIQATILFTLFLRKDDRRLRGSSDMRFKPALFKECMRVGVPVAIAHGMEVLAWTLLIDLVAIQSELHMVVFAICQSVFIFFAFVSEGFQKGVTAVAANYIGAKAWEYIPKMFRSGVRLCTMVLLVLLIPCIFYPDVIVNAFLVEELQSYSYEELQSLFQIAFVGVWLAMFFEQLAWLSIGVILGAGDTRFLMIMMGLVAWFGGFLPVGIGLHIFHAGPLFAPLMLVFYTICNSTCFYLRYRSGRWKQKVIA